MPNTVKPQMSSTNAIEKQIFLRAPRARVWRALTDAREFGTWFGVSLDGPIEQGTWVYGRITHPGYAHVRLQMLVERVEPEVLFAYRWHPYAVEPNVDYSKEPMTLIEFALEEVGGGTRLTITESGFEAIPLARREQAYRANEGGWEHQLRLVGKYLEN